MQQAVHQVAGADLEQRAPLGGLQGAQRAAALHHFAQQRIVDRQAHGLDLILVNVLGGAQIQLPALLIQQRQEALIRPAQ